MRNLPDILPKRYVDLEKKLAELLNLGNCQGYITQWSGTNGLVSLMLEMEIGYCFKNSTVTPSEKDRRIIETVHVEDGKRSTAIFYLDEYEDKEVAFRYAIVFTACRILERRINNGNL